MENVTQNVSQKNNNKGLEKMKNKKMSKADIMSDAITEYILDNDFLIRYITDNVKEKIYDEKTYHISMIEDVIENDLQAGYNGGYISDYILDEINLYILVDKIDARFIYDFIDLAEQTQQRNW